MKLERFNKNEKLKRLIVCSIIGIFIIIGTIILYRSYAFFEEKKEFNILKGQIPEFVENDIAIRLNGTITDKIPDKGDYNVEVSCDNAEGSWNYVEWKIDIKDFDGGKVKCSLNFIPDNTNSNNLSYKASIGDYISMTPTLDEFTITSNLTGYINDQTINPQTLKLWRIINIYEDGKIDIISEYTSYENIIFGNVAGYQNFIGTLNLIASAYSKSEYTIGARSIGYNSQTPFLSNNSIAITSANNNTLIPLNPSSSNNNEIEGGGDIMYQEDIGINGFGSDDGIVYKALKTLKTNQATELGTDSTIASAYWLASRNFTKIDNSWNLFGRSITNTGGTNGHYFYNSDSGSHIGSRAFRPILTLKSNIQLENQTGKDGKSIATAWQLN